MERPETGLILGIIVVEDVFLALYLALLQPVIGDASGAGDALLQVLKALAFLVVLFVVARRGANLVARLVDDPDDELLSVCFVGVAVLLAGIAQVVGVSDAIGAFMAGLILGGCAVGARIKKLVLPLRDTFGALFFFAFGLQIEPGDVLSVAGPVLLAVAITIVLNSLAGALAARVHGLDRVAGTAIALSVLARGEFSLIIASLGIAAGLDTRLGAFTAGYVLLLAIAGPIAAAHSDRIAGLLPLRRAAP
jgi:CPA2 family monovalent cation:H+ antiporter-2